MEGGVRTPCQPVRWPARSKPWSPLPSPPAPPPLPYALALAPTAESSPAP